PGLRQSLEAVEPVNRVASDALGDKAHGPAGVDSELEVVSLGLDDAERILDELALAVEAERIRHHALDVVDASLQRSERTFALGMNPPDVGGLIEATDDPVQERFQLEVGHQHRGCVPSATRARLGATAMITNADTPRLPSHEQPGRMILPAAFAPIGHSP